ncbi:unnamed protein product [Cochlearia groenlandica]
MTRYRAPDHSIPRRHRASDHQMSSITEGRITRAKARELAGEIKTMLNKEAPGGAAAQDVCNLFQATEEGKILIKNLKSFVSFGFEKKSPLDSEKESDHHRKLSFAGDLLPSTTFTISHHQFTEIHHLTIKTDSSPPVLKRHHPSLPSFSTIPPPPALYLTIRTASHHPQSAAPSSASSRVKIAREDRIMKHPTTRF